MKLMLGVMDIIRNDLQESKKYKVIKPKWRATKLWRYAKEKGEKAPLKFLHSTHPLAKETGYRLPDRLEVMIMGAFRTNSWFSVDGNGDVEYIGFLKHPERLWHDHSLQYMQVLSGQMQSVVGTPKPIVAFNALEGCYTPQLAQFEFGNDKNLLAQDPEFVLDVNDDGYCMENDPKKATHHLETIGGHVVKIVEMKKGVSTTEPNYRKL
jgi:hypothetical protein